MKRKFSSIWRVALALVLVLSLGLVMATPVSANTVTITAPITPVFKAPGGTVDVTWTFDAGDAGDFTIEIWDTALGNAAAPVTVNKTTSPATQTVNLYAVVAEGGYNVKVYSHLSALSDEEIDVVVIDTTPPTMDSAETMTTTTIDVTFSEDLDSATVAADGSDFGVTNPARTVTAASETAAGVVTVTVSAALQGNETPTVTLLEGQAVSDVAGYPLPGPVSVVATDGIDPTITGLTAPAYCYSGNVTAYTVTGTTELNADVDVSITDGTTTVSGTDVGDPTTGAFSVTLNCSTLDDGTITIDADAEDAVGNTYTAASITRTKDAVAPTVTIVTKPPAISISTTANYDGTAADAAPSSGLSVVSYKLDGGVWTTATGTATWSFTLTNLGSGPHTVNIKAEDTATNETTPPESHSFVVDLVPGAPVILDAVTGWGWNWIGTPGPDNLNDRTSIMVVFSEPLDPATVQKADFSVTGYAISDIRVFDYYDAHAHEWDGLSTNDFSLVFLKLTSRLPTDATPTVNLVGTVSDWSGFVSEPVSVVAQDGIAPLITLSVSPAKPVYNQYATITATATEELSEAYWGVDILTPGEGELMTPDVTGKVWTHTSLWTYEPLPLEKLHFKIFAHDFTAVETCKWWTHEKWTEESLIWHVGDYVEIDLCEGWNLISVPKPLADPSLNDVFYDGSVTTVYQWTGYGWQYATFNPVAGTWYGTITSIVPGKGYWVWCSPNEYTLGLRLTLPDPLAPPPSYSLVTGWNLIGFTVYGEHPWHDPLLIKHYLMSLQDNATIMYHYDASTQVWTRYSCGILTWSWQQEDMLCGSGYWLYLTKPAVLAP